MIIKVYYHLHEQANLGVSISESIRRIIPSECFNVSLNQINHILYDSSGLKSLLLFITIRFLFSINLASLFLMVDSKFCFCFVFTADVFNLFLCIYYIYVFFFFCCLLVAGVFVPRLFFVIKLLMSTL